MLSELRHQILRLLEGTNNDHIADGLGDLSEDELKNVLNQLTSFDGSIKNVNAIFAASVGLLEKGVTATPPEPADSFSVFAESNKEAVERYDQLGRDVIRGGRGCVLILAGGSGTRLGVSFPKGKLVCPLLKQQKSLFQLHAEKVLKLQQMCGGEPIQFALMTSEHTDADTRQFFIGNNYFGLKPAQVHFFVQASIPSLTLDGRLVWASKGKIATAPSGNGGVYSALAGSGTLAELSRNGVEFVQIFTVDNILAKLGDPVMFGYAVAHKCDVVVKATPKAHDHEAVGVFAKRDGKWGVVEYTEISKEMAESKTPSGERLFDNANIAIHQCSVDFLTKTAERMSSFDLYHVAKKPIACASSPTGSIPGIKLEAFIFDLFQFAAKFSILQVRREDEFSPVKNAEDTGKSDTPATAVAALHAMHRRWIEAAGYKSKNIVPKCHIEIPSAVSYAGEGLDERHVKAVREFEEKCEENDTCLLS